MTEFAREYEMSHDDHERIVADGLLSYLHDQVKLAQIYQVGLEQAAKNAEQPLDAGNAAIDYSHEAGQVSMPHKRIVMGPKYRYPVVDKIDAVILRAPLTEVPNQIKPETGHSNDLFMEVWHGRRRPHYYLLNSKGLVRYRSVDDIVSLEKPDENGDKCSINQQNHLSHKIPVEVLDHALRQYVFRPQTNDDRPPFYT